MRRKPVSEWTMDELKEILKRVRMALGEEHYKVMNAVVETLSYLTHLAKDKQAAEIYRILGSSKSEKTRNILRVLQMESATDADTAADPGESDKPAETSAQSSALDGPTGGPRRRSKDMAAMLPTIIRGRPSDPGFAGIDKAWRPLPVRQRELVRNR